MFRRLALLLCLLWAASAPSAQTADDLLDTLRVPQMLEIMRAEGLAYGDEMARDMFGTAPSRRWTALIDDIYDTAKMDRIVRREFGAAIDGTDLAPLSAFFGSDEGQRVMALELGAREAMIDDAVEEAARATFRDLAGSDDETLAQIDRFVAANDLLEANVAGALNASFQFYRGLVDGGAFAMSEADILADVWAQESETRDDTREWLYGFMLLAYQPLERETLEAYVALSASPEGRALNRALFAGFNQMYDDISYALGLAAAQQMKGEDL